MDDIVFSLWAPEKWAPIVINLFQWLPYAMAASMVLFIMKTIRANRRQHNLALMVCDELPENQREMILIKLRRKINDLP